MIKVITPLLVLCFLYTQKATSQATENSLGIKNELIFDLGTGVSVAHPTDLLINKVGKGIRYSPVAGIFVKKYFTVQAGNITIPLYIAVGAVMHLSNDPTKPIMPQARVGYRYGHITPFVARVWQKAGTTDYTKHPDNKNYWGYGVEVNKRLTQNGAVFLSVSKNDRHIVSMISIGFIF